ncbi:MAG TPA: RHS repeat-associated core domain-containing protein [Terriglobia bacterium]|nr:RHS repeat-associated core domain-containing protein [Terriglobia bacterium]
MNPHLPPPHRQQPPSHNHPRYDAEGRISADTNLNTQTFYDAQGRRDIIKAPSLQYPDYYVYDLQDHPLGIWNPAYAYFRGEYYAGGRHVANFSNLLMFMHPDWLGTEHYRTESNGTLYGSCQNDPFGDNMWCSEAQGDLSPVHFTGKERDYSGTANPDGLDYFGARYYSSNMARFMSPDWAAKPTAVPYAMLGDPQSLNLYTYVVDDPMSMIDPDGHQDCAGGGRSDPENHGLGTCDSIEKENKKAKTVCDASGLHCHTTVEVHAQSTACGPNSLCEVVLERLRYSLVFTKTFATNFVSLHFYKQEISSGGCLNVAGRATVSALNPFSSTPSMSSDAAAGAMTAGAINRWNAAQGYAASRTNVLDGEGLIFPQKSIPYNKILDGSRAATLTEGLLGYLDGALFQGVMTEAEASSEGVCQ